MLEVLNMLSVGIFLELKSILYPALSCMGGVARRRSSWIQKFPRLEVRLLKMFGHFDDASEAVTQIY
jgi:hypothetical protein